MSANTRLASPIAAQSTCGCAASTPLKDRAALNTRLAAIYIGKAEGTLKNNRSLGITDPPFVQDGRSITYRVSDLDDYLERHMVGGN
ncbi:hypothetical protein [Nesterenkonia halotolerans]|uniref:DNA-binding protein n=1 Tax=Nesterenkonia halotolerans TaxID=225325 RepID=A0ABR9J5L0_9MICC|nr:hypothetical protein [Nesterenkonia halotolerans]MBE1514277.1 hypothetical protein [Nesterenkonia halotolerans]